VALIGLLAFPLLALGQTLGADKPKGKPKDPTPRYVANRKLFVEGTNDSASWKVKVSVDHDDLNYQVGDVVKVTVTSEHEGYLYVFNLDPEGEITCLYPNKTQNTNQIAANKSVLVGAGAFDIKVSEPTGKDIVYAIVTTEPLKDLKLDELTKSAKKKSLTARRMKRLVVEAMTGDPDRGNGGSETSVSTEKDKFQQDSPTQYKQKAKEWSSDKVEINTFPGKGKPGQDQEKPKPGQSGQDKKVKP